VRPGECGPVPRQGHDRPADRHVDLCFEQRVRQRPGDSVAVIRRQTAALRRPVLRGAVRALAVIRR
jgi:hypothetical protein